MPVYYDTGRMKSLDPLPLRLLTHNIRYAKSPPSKGEEIWDIRKHRLINELNFNSAQCINSFICLQEVLHSQLLDILNGLNSGRKVWDYIGVGRDDGHEAGEYSPIFYQPTTWTLQSYKNVWLSETPDRPSKGWDAASTRILTIGVFQHRQTKSKIVAMNTHLDDQGSQSRLEATKIILEQISNFTTQTDGLSSRPLFLAGDFNSEPNQEAYEAITSDESPMCDLHNFFSEEERYGEFNTFTGFGSEGLSPTRIDFLFVNQKQSPNSTNDRPSPKQRGRWSGESYGILANHFEDGVYCSDHRAVVCDLLLH